MKINSSSSLVGLLLVCPTCTNLSTLPLVIRKRMRHRPAAAVSEGLLSCRTTAPSKLPSSPFTSTGMKAYTISTASSTNAWCAWGRPKLAAVPERNSALIHTLACPAQVSCNSCSLKATSATEGLTNSSTPPNRRGSLQASRKSYTLHPAGRLRAVAAVTAAGAANTRRMGLAGAPRADASLVATATPRAATADADVSATGMSMATDSLLLDDAEAKPRELLLDCNRGLRRVTAHVHASSTAISCERGIGNAG
mmetsp:Transcript_9220/g.16221  ORF Transcript_9220/g.16221 Transcript_9220/m.16221 type:complete len:253 (+) Transcript_9220:362-1120(+)